MDKNQLIKIAQFGVAHGLRGQVKVKCFLENTERFSELQPLFTLDATNTYICKVTGMAKGQLIVSVEGCHNRTQAEALRNIALYAPREKLLDTGEQDTEGFLMDDLIGLDVRLFSGDAYGKITGVYNFGAGDILEICQHDGKYHMLTFTYANFPELYVNDGYIVCNPPELLGGENIADEGH